MHENLVLVAITALLTTAQVPRFVLERDTLTLADRGYLLGSPVHVAGPGEFAFRWSPDGRYLGAISRNVAPQDRIKAAIGQQVPVRESLVVWDGKEDRTFKVAEQSGLGFTDLSGWMGGSSLIFQQARLLPSGPQRNEPEAEVGVYRWTPGQANPSRLLVSKGGFIVSISKKLPYGIVAPFEIDGPPLPGAAGQSVNSAGKPATFFVTASGMPKQIEIPGTGVFEDKAGYLWTSTVEASGTGASRKVKEQWKRLTLTGTWEAVDTKPDLLNEDPGYEGEDGQPTDPNGIQIAVSQTAAAQGPVKTQVQSAWLWAPVKGVIHAALVAAETNGVSLSPTKDKIAYVSQEHLLVRALEPISLKELNILLEATERRLLLSNGKQVALGLIMCAGDNDDNFPANAGWQDAIRPYLKNDSIFTGFVYEMNGENAAKIDEPAKKRLGYIQGAHGRVLVYSDGHAVWESKNP